MMNTTVNISALTVFVFLGVFQGIIISAFLIFKRSQNREANIYQGLMFLSLSLCILEQFLNMTGLIVKVLFVTNTTEPLNLVIGPLLYMYVKRSLNEAGSKKELLDFILPFLYLGYMFLDFVQPIEYKYNSYINSYHPDWPLLSVTTTIPGDPLKIKKYLNLVTALQLLFYIVLSSIKISNRLRKVGGSRIKTNDDSISSLRNMVLHVLAIVAIFVTVKLTFKGDLGDYFIGLYVSVLAFITTFRIMNDSAYFDGAGSFMDISISKYKKSSLNEERKEMILRKVFMEFESKQYFTENLASLTDLSKRVGESQHHVSQVINEKLNKNFFELLASFRIEKAKSIITADKNNKLTIEEISEMVGYNSKTAFNNAFKKLTGKTPSEYRIR
jgi:AraC-like DNA-binding protein